MDKALPQECEEQGSHKTSRWVAYNSSQQEAEASRQGNVTSLEELGYLWKMSPIEVKGLLLSDSPPGNALRDPP